MNAMNRREFLGGSLAVGAELAHPHGLFAFPAEQAPRADAASARPMPQWLDESPIVMAGCWDEFPLFQRRRGDGPTWAKEIYAEQGTEETVRKLKDVGVTLAMIHFYKGFGLEAERPHIEKARELSKRLKQHGIRVGLYVGSTIFFETFLAEKPEAAEWFVPDYLGRPVVYPGQPFRRRVYFMHPGYRDYIKKVLRLGIESLHADMMHFDNTSIQAEPAIFQHPLAIQNFRDWLGKRYSGSKLTERLGFSNVSHVTPPEIAEPPEIVSNPLLQEWTDFRVHQLTEYYAEMASFIRSVNPETAIENNPAAGLSGKNTIWTRGMSFPRIMRQVDVTFTEEGNNAGVSPEGILVSKIRTFKMAAPRNKTVFSYTYGSLGDWGYEMGGGGPLQMAESMAYNRQSAGMIGGFHDAPNLPAPERRYVRFFRDNFEIFHGVRPVSDVALLYSYSTMGFNNGRPQESFMLASQMLIQNRLLFDIVFDDQLANISKYPVLFLVDQRNLSDAQIKRIRDYVSEGGGLVATGDASLYTAWGKRRRNFGLRDCFGVDAPGWRGHREPESVVPGGPVRRHFGKGKVAYLPQIVPSVKRPAGEPVSSQYWAPAANQQEIRDAVQWAIGEQPTVETEASLSPYVTINLVHQEAKNRLVLHVLNYDHARKPSVQNVQVEVAIPTGKKVKSIQMATPDRSGQRELKWTGERRARFVLPSVEIYSIAVLDLD